MQQLLTLNGQSELFLKSSGEAKLAPSSSEGADAEASEFARTLLAGLDVKKGNGNEAAATRPMLTAESVEKRTDAGGNKLQKLDFDDSKVGKPVDAPILEMLEEMQALLQPGADVSSEDLEQLEAELSAADGKLAEQMNKLSELLASLGAESLSDEQRQQLAGELMVSLSDEQQQQLTQFLSGDVSELIVKGAPTQAAEEALDSELLARLTRVSELAEAAVKVAGGKLSLDNEPAPTADAESLEWLVQQVKRLQAQSPNSQSQGAEQSAELFQQLQQRLDADTTLTAEQKQQVQQLLAQLEQQMTAGKDAATGSNSQAALLSQVQKMLEQLNQSNAGDKPVTAERTQPSSGDATTKPAQQASKVVGDAQPTDADDAATPRSTTDKANADKTAEVKPDNSVLSGLAERSSASRSESAQAFSNELINQQSSPVSTQTGTVKATEMSSTLQSSMQSIQKPFDPQQTEASQKLQERINIMLSKNIQRADIRLDPPELGQMQVRINMNSEQATVQFQVQSAQAREAVETALPRLREMLEQQGVALADTDVQEQQQQTAGQQGSESSGGGKDIAGEDTQEYEINLENGRPLGLGAVDFYV